MLLLIIKLIKIFMNADISKKKNYLLTKIVELLIIDNIECHSL